MKNSIVLEFVLLAAFLFFVFQWIGMEGTHNNKSAATEKEYKLPAPELAAL